MTKAKSKCQTIETIKLYSIVFFIGAVLSCTAPFIHIFYPNKANLPLQALKKEYKAQKITRAVYILKKQELTYFGYDNKTKFWYAIGKPIAMLYFSIALLYASFYIGHKTIRTNIRIVAISASLISFYFIIWAFWYRADLPKTLYYTAIGIISILATTATYGILKSRNKLVKKIQLLTAHIVFKGKKHVAPENKEGYTVDYMRTFKKLSE